MGDERDQEAQRMPLWPPDNPPPTPEAPPAWRSVGPDTMPAAGPASGPATGAETGTGAPPYGGPFDQPSGYGALSMPPDAPNAANAPNPPDVPDPSNVPLRPAWQSDAPQAQPTEQLPAQAGERPSPFAPAPQFNTAPAAPPAPPAQRKGLSTAWRLGLTLLICVLLLAGAAGLYAYASSLAAQPQRIMTNYCAALIHDNYRDAYRLLSSSAQAQEAETRYLSDASARDTISGRVTQCAASPTQTLSPLSFLRSPRSLIFNATITRKQAATGQIALTRDASGWHVAALSSTLQGVDLGPLYTEQALCTAFAQRAYNQAYALLSTPFQKEQGDAATFARSFGATLTVTGCAPNLKSYSVNHADQQATLDATLALSVTASGGGSPSAFSLPAQLRFVREATGWRVDAITPQLTQ